MEINKIYNENCLDTMAQMENNFIDLTVTSPPYDNLRDYNGYTFGFEAIAKQLFRVTKKGGVVVWVVGDAIIEGSETGTSFRQALNFKEIGFRLHDTMIFAANKPPQTNNRYEQAFEYMFVFSKENPKTFNPIKVKCINTNKKQSAFKSRNKDGSFKIDKKTIVHLTKIKSNIWFCETGFSCSSKDKISFQHPATFPEKLAADHICSWSNENDLIYDPFMGSGTTAKMAIMQKRNYIGSEISSEYCELAEKRIEPYKRQTNLF